MAISDNYNSLTFGGVNSLDYGVYISGPGVYNAPTRAVEFVDVPGRNGAIEIDQGHWNNIEVTYTAGMFADDQADFGEKMNAFRNAIVSQVGYQRLTDTYNPEHYRLGVYASGIDVNAVRYNDAGEFNLTFTCKPQRYLTDGDTAITVASGDTITNPTLYDAESILEVYGYGAINFDGQGILLSNEPYGDVFMKRGFEETKNTSAVFTINLDDAELLDNGDTIGPVKIVAALYCPFNLSPWVGNWIPHWSHPWTDGLTTIGGVQCPTATFNLTYQKGTPSAVSGEGYYSRNYRPDPDFMDDIERDIALTVIYDGNNTITVTATTVYEDGMNPFETVVLSVNDIYGVSTIPVIGDPSYLDFAVGEAWRTMTVPGKPRGDIFMRSASEETKNVSGSSPVKAEFPLVLSDVDLLETGDSIGVPFKVAIRVAMTDATIGNFNWTTNWTRSTSSAAPWTDGVTTISDKQWPTATFELNYRKGTATSTSGSAIWIREYTSGGVTDLIERCGTIIVDYDGADTIKVTYQGWMESGYQPFTTAITSVNDIHGFSSTPITDPTEKVVSINNVVALPSDLPKLRPGDNTIIYNDTITDLKIVPKWWEL